MNYLHGIVTLGMRLNFKPRILTKLHWSLALILLYTAAFSQANYSLDQSIDVKVQGKSLSMPWAGGLNSPQLNTLDLNADGKEDLVIFDRMANKILTYLNIGNQYRYSPGYESYFPSSISDWVLLRDFNCDGKKDLFTTNPAGISVFVNTTKAGGLPTWRAFYPGHPLLTIGFSGSINLQMNATDIPAIDDVDEDGDLDVIVARFVGFGSLEFHKNMSMENTGRCDSMQLVRVTTAWGNFEECNCARFAFGGINCSQLPGGRILHDAGKSLLTLDLNNDGLHDLLFSEQNCTSLYLLPNEGTPSSALMNTFSDFPAAAPSTLLFPAAYFEDVDFDGVKDLTIATNISARVTTDIDMAHSVWFYKNTGTNSLPQFSFQKTNFLQDQMIDAGSYTSPAFADYDNDGDLDLFISYWSVPDSVASIYQYENTGNFYSPSFQLVTNDYQQFLSRGLYNIKIQFIDTNGDGKTDLAFTATDKNTSVTQLYSLVNTSSAGFDFAGQSPEPLGFVINQLESVLLYDVNKDGLLDILWGKSDGSLQYYKNTGSFVFVSANAEYLGLKASVSRFCVSPSVSDLKHDGKPDLLIGNHGSIVVFNDFQSGNPSLDSIKVSNMIKGVAEASNLSTYVTVTTGDLYNSANPLIFVGTITGGVLVLKPDNAVVDPNENTVSFWPNPLGQNEKINIRASQNSVIQFFNILGQKIDEPFAVMADTTQQIEQSLSGGLYFAKVSWDGKSKTVKLVVK
jgi:hypothetical protein